MPAAAALGVAARAFWAAVLTGMAVYVGAIALGVGRSGGTAEAVVNDWLANAIPLAAALACLARGALVRSERLAWLVIGAGILSWTAGNLVWTLTLVDRPSPPFPSLADAFWLGLYPALYVGLVLLVRARLPRFDRGLWLDGLIGALAVSSVAAALVFQPVLDHTGGSVAAVATNLAYPLAAILLLAFVIGVGAASGWRPGRGLVLIGAGLLALGGSDGVYLYLAATDRYVEGGPLDAGYVVGLLLIAAAAHQTRGREHVILLSGRRALLPPTIFALVAMAVLVYAEVARPGWLAIVLALLTVLAAMGRAALTFAENGRLADSRRQAARLAGALEAILGTAGVGICGLDRHGAITYANAAAGDLAGEPAPALLGRPLDALLSPAGPAPAGGDGPAELQGTLLRADGSDLPVEYVLTETADHGIGTGVVVLNDVSERRALERMKSEFVAVTSHELRTPLTSVIGYLEALLDDDGDDGTLQPEHRRLLGVVQRNADRLARLVDDLFVVSQFDSGRVPLGAADLDLGGLARECVESASPAAAERGVDLAARVDGEVPVRGDAERLGQVLDNLVGNAVKFTPAGGRVDVAVRVAGGTALLEVRDTGIGIPAEEQRALFERFYRASSAVAAQVPGTGLGLAIVKMIVEAHGGRVSAESAEGAGSTFRVELPLAARAPALAGAS